MSFARGSFGRPICYASNDRDINILLLGETGVGKSTFVNAFANYLVYDELIDAINGETRVLIPCAFNTTDPNTFETKKILIGDSDDDEHCGIAGQSSTQVCHSYLFPIGNRVLCLIDAPGVGDTRGINYDTNNCDHICSYLNNYEYLNGICILLKPDVQRLTVGFRFCIKQVLTQLNISARDNLMFVFTNARSTFYKPGPTTPILREFLNELNQIWRVEIPFNTGNTFMFDNESFRFLALQKSRMKFSFEEQSSYANSWKNSVNEIGKLITRIVKCDSHAVADSISINGAQQLIRILTRPIGEIARLIQENIQLAQNQKQNALNNPLMTLPKKIPQKTGKFVPLKYPRTVCTSQSCTEIIMIDNQRKKNYKTQCHEHCYLRGVERECVGNSILQYCDAINQDTDLCKICGCHWEKHMHILYEYKTSIELVDVDNSDAQMFVRSIEKRIADLEYEKKCIIEVCGELSQFIRENAMLPFNDDVLEYIKYLIEEEKQKRMNGENNQNVIRGLENMVEQCKFEQQLMSQLDNKKTKYRRNEPEDIYAVVARLYKLPINGPSIKQQVRDFKQRIFRTNNEKEYFIKITPDAQRSAVMTKLERL